MPYIPKEDRSKFDIKISELSKQISDVGELNYVLTRIAMQFLIRIGLTYANISNVVGTLNLIPLEIWRRIGMSYEDRKARINGDVPEFL